MESNEISQEGFAFLVAHIKGFIDWKEAETVCLKFRFLSLQGTFNSYQRLWDRVLFQIEMGTYEPHKKKADRHVGKLDKNTGRVIESEEFRRRLRVKPREEKTPETDEMRKLYDQYIVARLATAEKGEVSFSSFRKSLENQTPSLKKILGDNFRFKVAVEKGKAKIKGVKV